MAQIPVSHPQPSPWSEELDQFCTRVFKKSNHNKAGLASLSASQITERLSHWPVLSLHHRHCFGSLKPPLMSQSGVSREFKHEVRVRLLQSLAHVSIQTPYGVQGSQDREGREGQTLPRQSSPLDRASDCIPRAHPPFPPHPNSGGGGAAVTRAYVGEGFGSAQNEHQR